LIAGMQYATVLDQGVRDRTYFCLFHDTMSVLNLLQSSNLGLTLQPN
jgi:hypothetical protein